MKNKGFRTQVFQMFELNQLLLLFLFLFFIFNCYF